MDERARRNVARKVARKVHSPSTVAAAIARVNGGSTVYAVAKEYGIAWSTLKDHLKRTGYDESNVTTVVHGRKPALIADLEDRLVNYIREMQEIVFGLSATDIRRIAFEMAETAKIKHPFINGIAGWAWWCCFRKRNNLTMRSPQNLSQSRAAAATRENLDDFYNKLQTLAKKLGIVNKPERFYNVDETGLSYVLKATKVVRVEIVHGADRCRFCIHGLLFPLVHH